MTEEKNTSDEVLEDTLEDQVQEEEMINEDDPLTLMTQERDQYKDQLLRQMAEFDNFKRRTKREKEQLYTDSVSDVVTAFLPVMDNLERALLACEQVNSEEAKSLAEGVKMIGRQADETLKKLGVEEIEAEGVPFDPIIHNAVAQVEDETVESGTVVDVLAKGYKRGSWVIRHAMVRVAQ